MASTRVERAQGFLRFEEEGVPRCILGEDVCGQSEQLIRPNLENMCAHRQGQDGVCLTVCLALKPSGTV